MALPETLGMSLPMLLVFLGVLLFSVTTTILVVLADE